MNVPGLVVSHCPIGGTKPMSQIIFSLDSRQETSRKQLQLLRFLGVNEWLETIWKTDLFRNGSMIMQGFLMSSWFSIFFPYFLIASNKSLVFLDVSLFLKHKKTSLPRLEHCDVLDGTTSCFIHFLVAGRSFKAHENLTWRWGISCITLCQQRMTLPLFGLLGSGRFGRGTGNSWSCTYWRSQRQLIRDWQPLGALVPWSKNPWFLAQELKWCWKKFGVFSHPQVTDTNDCDGKPWQKYAKLCGTHDSESVWVGN